MKESLTAKVTEQGVIIPREWFAGVEEVEIRRENGRVVVDPKASAAKKPKKKALAKDDPIWNLGKSPIDIGITDASVNLDRYLYNHSSQRKDGKMSSSTVVDIADDSFKKAVKDAVIDALCEQKELFHEVFSEVLEDFALAEAIRKGRKTKEVSRGDVFEILKK